jgi:hypothetical protein
VVVAGAPGARGVVRAPPTRIAPAAPAVSGRGGGTRSHRLLDVPADEGLLPLTLQDDDGWESSGSEEVRVVWCMGAGRSGC